MTNDAALAPLIDSYLDLRWQFDPVQATDAGRTEHDHRLGRFGRQEVKEHVAALRALANAVAALPLEDHDDELDRTAVLNEIRVSVHRYEHERPQVRNPEFWLSHIRRRGRLLAAGFSRRRVVVWWVARESHAVGDGLAPLLRSPALSESGLRRYVRKRP